MKKLNNLIRGKVKVVAEDEPTDFPHLAICINCWNELREGLKNRGLEHLISKNGKHAANRMAKMMSPMADPKDNDPLVGAWMAIMKNLIESFGTSIFAADAPKCMLCWMNEHAHEKCSNPNCIGKHDTGHDWINFASDDQLKRAQEDGLVPLPN